MVSYTNSFSQITKLTTKILQMIVIVANYRVNIQSYKYSL